MHHGAINFVEIAVTDLTRAANFYAGMFGWSFESAPDSRTWYFSTGGGPMGAITTTRRPSSEGAHVFVTVDDIRGSVVKATQLGGWIEHDVMSGDPAVGEIAVVRDYDGNWIGLFHNRLAQRPAEPGHRAET